MRDTIQFNDYNACLCGLIHVLLESNTHTERRERERDKEGDTTIDYKNLNIIAQLARNNSHCFKIEPGNTNVSVQKQLLPKDCERLESLSSSTRNLSLKPDLLSTFDQN